MNRSIAACLLAAALLLPARELARADNEPLLWPDGTITYRDWGLYRPGVPILIDHDLSQLVRHQGMVELRVN